jgi:hypothetical protein
VRRQPIAGSLVLAGEETETTVGLVVAWGQTVTEVQLFVDGKEMPTIVEPVSDTGTGNGYYVSASVTGLEVGDHTVRANIKGRAGELYATEWTFLAAVPDAQNMYFKETGYFVSSDFYAYWKEHGGLDIFGFPISERVRETDPASGEVYVAQYFQRARFELHPSTGNEIVLGRLGVYVHTPDPPATMKPGAQFFAETGHNLSGQFLQFWQRRGGLSIFGYPISEERAEINPQDGKEYHVQYFERARFELHPELAGTPYEVQLGQLGTQLYRGK